jgi:hypothetical protein
MQFLRQPAVEFVDVGENASLGRPVEAMDREIELLLPAMARP